jgi:hypothetical protein
MAAKVRVMRLSGIWTVMAVVGAMLGRGNFGLLLMAFLLDVRLPVALTREFLMTAPLASCCCRLTAKLDQYAIPKALHLPQLLHPLEIFQARDL